MPKTKLETFCIVGLFLAVLCFTAPIQATVLFSRVSHLPESWLMEIPVLRQIALARYNAEPFLREHYVAKVRSDGFYILHTKIWEGYEDAERGIIPQDALMVRHAVGAAYYVPDLAIIDYFGLTDYAVARNPVAHANDNRKMGHDRKPSVEYIKERAPNIYVFPPAGSLDAALAVAAHAVEVGPGLWMPFDAVNGQWARARFGQRNFHSKIPELASESIVYDRGLSLTGFAVWHESQGPLRWVVRLSAAPGVTEVYSLSLRLYNDAGLRVFQHDEVLRNLILNDNDSTSAWPPGQIVDVASEAPIPDLPPGEYEVGIVFYDIHSGNVTAELDTWRTEVTLATVAID